jgi:hypothetical protein
LRAAVASLMVTNTPNTVRLILIDPKKNAFGELSGSGYLWRSDSLIDTPEGQVIPVLTHLIEEMQHRYERFGKVSADNLLDYQRKIGLQLLEPPRIRAGSAGFNVSPNFGSPGCRSGSARRDKTCHCEGAVSHGGTDF